MLAKGLHCVVYQSYFSPKTFREVGDGLFDIYHPQLLHNYNTPLKLLPLMRFLFCSHLRMIFKPKKKNHLFIYLKKRAMIAQQKNLNKKKYSSKERFGWGKNSRDQKK